MSSSFKSTLSHLLKQSCRRFTNIKQRWIKRLWTEFKEKSDITFVTFRQRLKNCDLRFFRACSQQVNADITKLTHIQIVSQSSLKHDEQCLMTLIMNYQIDQNFIKFMMCIINLRLWSQLSWHIFDFSLIKQKCFNKIR